MECKEYFTALIDAIQSAPLAEIGLSIEEIQKTIERGGSIFTCGNGGSALTASHYVTDWGKMSWVNRKVPLRAFCLSDNVGMLSAYANDISYEECFSHAVENYCQPGDLLIAVSGSGNSENVIKAVRIAKSLGVKTIGVIGFDGGKLREMCDIPVHFPVNDMQLAEDLHLSFGHIVMKKICDE